MPKGHSDTALVDFLFNTKAGFCEQFSSAFAAMARSIGLPTRVAVGFTAGTPDPSGVLPRHHRERARLARGQLRGDRMGPLRAHTRAGSSHRPTTRARPATGSAEDHDAHHEAVGDHGALDQTRSNAELPQARRELDNLAAGSTDQPKSQSTAARVVHAVLVVVALIVGAFVLFVGVVAGLKALRRWRRRHASTPRERIIGAWDEVLERLAEARIHRRPSSTPVEFAMREGPAGGAGGAGPPLLALAHLATTVALYAPDEPDG